MKALSLMLTAFVLLSCDGSGDQSGEALPGAASPRTDDTAAAGAATGDDDCGSLAPLLAMLPTETALGGLPRTQRGCDLSAGGVTAIYTDGGADPTELRFDVQVIDGNSRLLDSTFPPDLTPEERRKVGDAASAPGEMSRRRLDQCRAYHRNPVIPGRNPRIVSQAGKDVCVMDTMDANKSHWFTFTFLPHLRVEIELTGPGAERLATTTAAADYLMPLFQRFRLDAAPPA